MILKFTTSNPLSMWRKTFKSVTRKHLKKKERETKKKGLKGGKDTEEKGGSFLHCMLTFFHSLYSKYALFESETVVLG